MKETLTSTADYSHYASSVQLLLLLLTFCDELY